MRVGIERVRDFFILLEDCWKSVWIGVDGGCLLDFMILVILLGEML